MKVLTLLLILLTISSASVDAAELVGWVDIRNGVEPEKAFLLERQGHTITPKHIHTDLEEGDIIKPLGKTILIFEPRISDCDRVEIKGEFKATACQPDPCGLKCIISSQYRQAKDLHTSRGDDDEPLYSLPPQPLKIFVESQNLADALKRAPFIVLTKKKADADLFVLGKNKIQVLEPKAVGGNSFRLPKEEINLCKVLLHYINFNTMANLSNLTLWPAVDWNINIHAPTVNGSLEYGGQNWALSKSMTLSDEEAVPTIFQAPSLLTFKLVNRSDRAYYVYLVNYTSEGQILPFFPPKESQQWPNILDAKAELLLDGVFLELFEAQEFVRLIISEYPLDLYPFAQGNLEKAVKQSIQPVHPHPAPEKSWFTKMVAFELK